MKADVIKALAAAQKAIQDASSQANASSEYAIPNGDVVANTSGLTVTISSDGKVIVEPNPVSEQLQDSQGFTKSASSYWATAAGSACSRCGGTGRA